MKADSSQPVTVIARHVVLPGKEDGFEAWLRGITATCSGFEGFLDTEIIRPMEVTSREYTCIFRFDRQDHLKTWMDSQERAQWISRVSELTEDSPRITQFESLEYWFSPQKYGGKPPRRHKMALVTFVALLPLVHFVPRGIGTVLDGPPILVEVASVAIIVLLMTYVVMPFATRLFSFLLYPERLASTTTSSPNASGNGRGHKGLREDISGS